MSSFKARFFSYLFDKMPCCSKIGGFFLFENDVEGFLQCYVLYFIVFFSFLTYGTTLARKRYLEQKMLKKQREIVCFIHSTIMFLTFLIYSFERTNCNKFDLFFFFIQSITTFRTLLQTFPRVFF